ncbi:hypothetical protein HJG60_009725 [Phyllostomus discolor]|uniref:Uncharacterized protein n=1 Tax=Phyllostomus discolor TaxID=89673 RepID=A0A834EL91_9CHIR|nr:hypothetical protein HJG60_009725 [Phyllostomus discolor]
MFYPLLNHPILGISLTETNSFVNVGLEKETTIKNLCWGLLKFLTFWEYLVFQKVGDDGIPTMYHWSRRNNHRLYMRVRLGSMFNNVEQKNQTEFIRLFKNRKTFHFMDFIFRITKSSEETALECRYLTLLPGLHHRTLRSSKAFLNVGKGTPSRGCIHSPSPTHQPRRSLHPSFASRSSVLFCCLFSNLSFTITCIYLNKCSIYSISNLDIT